MMHKKLSPHLKNTRHHRSQKIVQSMKFREMIQGMFRAAGMLTITAIFCTHLTAQEGKSPSGGLEPAEDKEIGELHKTLAERVNDYIGTQERDSLVLKIGMGSEKRGGERDHAVFEEEARISLSGGTPVAIEFYYTQTTEKSMITETRIVKNTSIRDEDIGKIQVSYSGSATDDVSFTVRDLHSKESQREILDYYKSKLNQCIRLVQTYKYARDRQEKLTVDRILLLGKKR